MFKISFSGKTDPGQKRTNNEDAFIAQNIWDDKHVLCVAIDGVGGYEGGEVAAELAQKAIVEYLEKYPNGERLDLLKQAVVEANNEIVKQREIRQLANMSCVLTACLIQAEKKIINMVHVGDTRLYQFYNGKLRKLSHDHSLVGYREEIGNLTEDEAMSHPQRNLIERIVGDALHQIDDENFLEAVAYPLLSNSILLLCSDGLCDMLKLTEMESVLQRNISLPEKVQDLIDFANAKGGKDNITVVLAEVISDKHNIVEDTNVENSMSDYTNKKITIEQSIVRKKEKTEKKHKDRVSVLSYGLAGILFIATVAIVGYQFGLDRCCKNDNYNNFLNVPTIVSLKNDTLIVNDSILKFTNDSVKYRFNDSISFQVTGKEIHINTLKK